MRPKYYRREVYNLALANQGIQFSTFLRDTKNSMIEKLLEDYNIEKTSTLKIEFTIQPLTNELLFDEVRGYQRADGQYVYRGDFTAREVIEEMVKKVSRVLTMTVYLEDEI